MPRRAGRLLRARSPGAGQGVRSARNHIARKEDVAMNTFDLSPLWQSTVGFDRLTDLMEDSVRRMGGDNYPPYNIERAGEDHYQISLAPGHPFCRAERADDQRTPGRTDEK